MIALQSISHKHHVSLARVQCQTVAFYTDACLSQTEKHSCCGDICVGDEEDEQLNIMCMLPGLENVTRSRYHWDRTDP